MVLLASEGFTHYGIEGESRVLIMLLSCDSLNHSTLNFFLCIRFGTLSGTMQFTPNGIRPNTSASKCSRLQMEFYQAAVICLKPV